jgi:hypothetical protein
MTEPSQPPLDQPVQAGVTIRRTWPVWSNRVEHRVDIELNGVTGSTRVLVDGVETARRSPWHMDMSGFELPFDVDGRRCLFVVRTKYGAAPEFDLFSEGRSLTTGDELEQRRASERREMPNLVRMLLLFIPLIGGLNTVILNSDTFVDVLGGYGAWVLVGVGAIVAAAGWWLASRWYASDPSPPARHVVGAAIVAGGWVVFFVAYALLLALGANEPTAIR